MISVSHKKKAENDISITYDQPDYESEVFGAPKIQLIKPVREGAIVAVGDRKTILENFDFTVVRCALLNPNEALVDADFEHDEKRKADQTSTEQEYSNYSGHHN